MHATSQKKAGICSSLVIGRLMSTIKRGEFSIKRGGFYKRIILFREMGLFSFKRLFPLMKPVNSHVDV